MELRRLPLTASGLVDEDFRSGVREHIELPDEPEQFVRVVNGSPELVSIDRLLNVFDVLAEIEDDGDLVPATDRWLAPRVHAGLRLTRLEACDPRVWNYLSVVVLPDYVRRRWRNPDKHGRVTTTLDRFAGRDRRKHALARLWWTAELLRNGPDYMPVVQSFMMQDIPNGLVAYDCFENRALAVGLVGELAVLNKGQPATSNQVKLVGRRINLWLATTALDVVAPDANTDPDRVRDWITEPNPDPIQREALPIGPDDGEIDPASLDAARALARRIIGLGSEDEVEDHEVSMAEQIA